jgi:hypothetical protein
MEELMVEMMSTCVSTEEKRKGPQWNDSDPIHWLIRAGWGDTPQWSIPADVVSAAHELRMPRENTRKRRNSAL